MATILERGIDTERGDAIALNALAMGEVPMLRAFIVKVRRRNETRMIFEAEGFDSMSVAAEYGHLAEAGEKVEVAPRCRAVLEQETATDYAQRRARENDQQAARLQMIDLDAMRRGGAL